MPQPKQSDAVPAPGISSPPPAGPQSSPAPAPAAPAAKPPDPPKPSFRSLDEDLAEFTAAPAPPQPKAPKPAKAAAGEPPAPAPPQPSGEDPAHPPEAPAAPAEPAEPEPQAEDDYLMGPELKAKDKPKTDDKPPETAVGPLKAPELRAEYAKVKKRLQEAEKELASLKTGAGKPDEGERKAFVSEIENLKKKLEEADSTIRAVAYEQSQEYQEKFEKPFNEAWNEGVQTIMGLTVQDQEGNTRQATAKDFELIMQIPNNEQAATLAQEMFGANAFYVLSQRRDLIKLHMARVRAMGEFKNNLQGRQKIEMERLQAQNKEQEQKRIEAQALFSKFNAQAAEKYPQFFAPVEGDEEGNNLLARGYRDVDMAFSGAQDLPMEKRVKLHSAIRNRAAAFSRLVYQLKGKDAEIAALKAELEEIKGSTPGPGQEGRERQETRRLTADEEIEAAAMQNTR